MIEFCTLAWLILSFRIEFCLDLYLICWIWDYKAWIWKSSASFCLFILLRCLIDLIVIIFFWIGEFDLPKNYAIDCCDIRFDSVDIVNVMIVIWLWRRVQNHIALRSIEK